MGGLGAKVQSIVDKVHRVSFRGGGNAPPWKSKGIGVQVAQLLKLHHESI